MTVIRPQPQLASLHIEPLRPAKFSSDDFALQQIDNFKGNKTEHKHLPKTNLLLPVVERFPYQPPWPSVHKALEFFRDDALRLLNESPARVLMTDESFHRMVREKYLKLDKMARTLRRVLHERGVSEDFADEVIQGEWTRLRERLKLTQNLNEAREQRHLLERFKILEHFAINRDHRWKVGHEWTENRKWLIDRAELQHKEYWDFRDQNLFTLIEPAQVVRLAHQGIPLEEVLAQIHHQKVLAILKKNQAWQFDQGFVILPNGGVTSIKNGAGHSKELLEAKVSLPVKYERTDNFRAWHESGQKIESPNGVPISAPQLQGDLSPKVEAVVHDRVLKSRLEEHEAFHKTASVVTLSNDGMTRTETVGIPIEKVTGDQYWIHRDSSEKKTTSWHEKNLYTRQGEVGVMSLPKFGERLEAVLGEIAGHQRVKKDDHHRNIIKNDSFVETANGGIGILPSSSKSFEEVSGAQGNQLAHQRSFAHQQWLWTGKNIAPSVKGPASLDHIERTPGMLNERAETKTQNEQVDAKISVAPEANLSDAQEANLATIKEKTLPKTRDKAVKAFQKALEKDPAASSSRFMAHAHIIQQPLQNSGNAAANAAPLQNHVLRTKKG